MNLDTVQLIQILKLDRIFVSILIHGNNRGKRQRTYLTGSSVSGTPQFQLFPGPRPRTPEL